MVTINQTYKNLYENKNDDADVTFAVHGQEVKAHKCIISDRSDMLKAMLNSGLTTADGRHVINDEKIKVEDFKQFLKFLYLDECDIDFTNLHALLHIGEMYLVPALKQRCMEFVKNECKESKSLEILEFCAKEFAQKFVDMGYLSAEIIEQIAKNCPRTAELTEDKLFVKIFNWAHVECTRLQVPADKNGIKNLLSPIIKYMKLENVSFHSWLHIIEPFELAPPEECIKIFKDFAKSCPQTALQLTPQMLENGATPLPMIQNNDAGSRLPAANNRGGWPSFARGFLR